MEYGSRMGRGDIVRPRVGRLDPPQQDHALQPDRCHDRVAVGRLRGLKSFLEEGREGSRETSDVPAQRSSRVSSILFVIDQELN